MGVEQTKAHRTFDRIALPYKSYVHPEDTSGYFCSGSKDILTSAKGYAERRYGFSDFVESVHTTFNDLQRTFVWNRFDGTFIGMACDINASNNAVVYKMIVGSDASFVPIFTDTSSNNPFDFVVSNNTVYFSNGNVAKKYDPINGVTNWGIAAGSITANTTTENATTSADLGGGFTPWTNPGNFISAAGSGVFSTVTVPTVNGTDPLAAQTFNFALSSTSTITGIQVTFAGAASSALPSTFFHVQLLKNGTPIGNVKAVFPSVSLQAYVLGSASDLWGTIWQPNDINQATFGFTIQAFNLSTTSSVFFEANAPSVTVFGTGGPSISVGGTGVSVTVGWQYVVCYGNSNSGHVSSPGPPSSSTGAFTNKTVSITLQASNDPQVNQIRVFRSTDSVGAGAIAGAYLELPTSPYLNTNQTITDIAADGTLNISSIAPSPGFNDPPTPAMCPVYFSGRVWMFNNNQLVFSDLEECVNGVPEESFTSGIAGNFFNFDEPIQSLEVAGNGDSQTLMIFCPGKIYGITGNSLDTFRRFSISNRRGCRSITNTSSLGGLVGWLDTSGQIWGADGNGNFSEMGIDIRPDTASINQNNSCVSFHVAGQAHWFIVSSGTKLFVFDMDTSQWMPPWTFSCNYLGSYEVSIGNYALVADATNTALQLNQSGITGNYNDNGVTYQPIMQLGLIPLVPDYQIYSSAYSSLASEPTKTGWPDVFQINTNANELEDVLVMADDDPTIGTTTYNSIFENMTTPATAFRRNQGANIIQNIFPMNQEIIGRWIGVQVQAINQDDNIKFYSLYVGVNQLPSRR